MFVCVCSVSVLLSNSYSVSVLLSSACSVSTLLTKFYSVSILLVSVCSVSAWLVNTLPVFSYPSLSPSTNT